MQTIGLSEAAIIVAQYGKYWDRATDVQRELTEAEAQELATWLADEPFDGSELRSLRDGRFLVGYETSDGPYIWSLPGD
jgi:hypothetical protein